MQRQDARVGLAATVLAVALLAGISPSSAVGDRGDGGDAAGPLDLAKLELRQRGGRLELEIATRRPLPPFGALTRRPHRVGAKGSRHLCLDARGPRQGRNLLCLAGQVEGGRIPVGRSTYGRRGWTKGRGAFKAKIISREERRVILRFPLRSARLVPGLLLWRVLSGWNGPACTQPSSTYPCLDRFPDQRYAKSRIAPLRLAGCTRAGGAIRHASRARKRIALTFDDGPSGYTAAFIDTLDRRGAKGTFFVVGQEIPGREHLLRRALRHGHEIGNHTMHHDGYPSKSDLRATSALIEKVTGFRPCTFRPPYEQFDSGTVAAAKSEGMSTILWDVDPADWTQPGAGAIRARVVSEARPGSIVLMHDGGGNRGQTLDALSGIVKDLRSRGYKLVTVTKLLGERFKRVEAR